MKILQKLVRKYKTANHRLKLVKKPFDITNSMAVEDADSKFVASKEFHDKVFFFVTCFGMSASTWFSHVLNLHPDITCTHSEENIFATDSLRADYQTKSENVYEGYQARVKRNLTSLDDFLKEIVAKGKTLAYGGVHTHRLSDLQRLESQFPGSIRFKLMNLVRHPVSIVNAGEGLVEKLIGYDIYVLSGLIGSIINEGDFFFKLVKNHKLNLLDESVLPFIGGCTNLLDLANDLKTLYRPFHIKMEQLTTDRDYFKNVVEKLVQNKVEISQDYVEQVFSLGNVNQHRRASLKQPAEIYADWQPWQKECFKYTVEKTGILRHYQNLGYDFSFVS